MPRPRTRDPQQEAPRQYVGGPMPRALKRQLELAAAFNGRSLNAEWQARLAESFRPGVGFPPELEAFLELLGRAMLEAGESVWKANRYSGHGDQPWVEDPYGWNQAADAAQRILELSRHEGGEPHGIFASADYPRELAEELGKQTADGILEVMRGRHEPEPGSTAIASQWAPQVRARLGSIGDRLDQHPTPEGYYVATRTPLGPDAAGDDSGKG